MMGLDLKNIPLQPYFPECVSLLEYYQCVISVPLEYKECTTDVRGMYQGCTTDACMMRVWSTVEAISGVRYRAVAECKDVNEVMSEGGYEGQLKYVV